MTRSVNKRIAYNNFSGHLSETKEFRFVRQGTLTNIHAFTNSAVWDYAISGTTMYAAADTDGIYVFDISDPANPVQGATVKFFRSLGVFAPTIPTTDVLVLGTDLFVCGRAIDWAIDNETGMLAKYNISDPLVPSWTATYKPPDMNPKPEIVAGNYGNNWYQGMATDGTNIYIASQMFGLTIINAATMAVVGTYDNDDMAAAVAGGFGDVDMFWECSRITYNNGWVYLANHGNGVLALDVSTPATPTNPQWYDAPIVNGVALRCRNLVNDGTYLYACPNIGGNTDEPERGLMVIDISDPTAVDINDWVVESIGVADNDTWIGAGDQPIMGLMIHRNRAYLANGQRGTAVFDITNPLSPNYQGLFGADMAAETNLYMSFVFSAGETYCYYSDAKEGAAQKHTLYFDLVKNP